MASEAKRGVIRIAANYTRVFTVVVLGLVIVRLLLKGAGNEGWALIVMLGATAGLGSMVQESVRASLITLLAIPLSLVTAILTLKVFGASINTMTLGGMAIAIGMLVDDAIIEVENIVRRLRENAALPADRQGCRGRSVSAVFGTGPGHPHGRAALLRLPRRQADR